MSEAKLTCAAMPLRADNSLYALVIGSREGMNSLLGSRSERLERRIDADEWALCADVRCLIGDEGAAVSAEDDDSEAPRTLAGMAVRMLYARYQRKLPGWTLLPCAPVLHNGQHLAEAMIACAVRWKLPADFLRWLVTDNACCSTVTDCAQWLIETEKPLPVQEAADSIVYVKSLAPYVRRNQWMLGGAGVLTAAAGLLCGHETVGAAMRDEGFRALLGNALIREIAPSLPELGEDGLAYAARVTAFLENACGEEGWPAVGENLIARFTACVLPALEKSKENNDTPAVAMELPDGRIVTGKTSSLLGAVSACILNALKLLAGNHKESAAHSLNRFPNNANRLYFS